MIYFIQNLQSNAVKVGYSEDPETRLAALRTANSDPLALLGTIPGDQALEAKLHAQFAAWKIHGEWFRGDVPLLVKVHHLIARHRLASSPDPTGLSVVPEEGRGSRGPAPIKTRTAMRWLRSQLDIGPSSMGQIRSMAREIGFTTHTLYVAMERIGIERFQQDGSMWVRLPSSEEQTG